MTTNNNTTKATGGKLTTQRVNSILKAAGYTKTVTDGWTWTQGYEVGRIAGGAIMVEHHFGKAVKGRDAAAFTLKVTRDWVAGEYKPAIEKALAAAGIAATVTVVDRDATGKNEAPAWLKIEAAPAEA